MKNIKYYSLICFFILLFVPFNISAKEDNVLIEVKDDFKFESVIERAKKSVILLSMNPNVDPETDPSQTGLCSGVVIDEVGHILTNFHCVYNQNYLRLYYYDEDDWQNYEVNVIGLDPLADLALIEVIGKEEPIPHLEFAENAGKIKSGTDVFALGHPMGMAWTVTKGIISSTERYARHPFIKAIQTDSAINKGNSGGPLLNMKGEIVGINTFIISKVKESAGIGIAIRSDTVQKSFKTMLEEGKVDRPAIGIMVVGLGTSDIQRTKLYKDNPSAKPGQIPSTFGMLIQKSDNMPENIKEFDTVFAVDDKFFNTHVEMSNILEEYNVGDTVTLSIIRNRRFMKLDIPLKIFEVPVEKMYKRTGR